MYTDDYIDFWGNIYQKVSINEYDLSFGVFMTDPKGCLKEIGQESALDCIENGFEPLLPAQAAVALRLCEQEDDIDTVNSYEDKSSNSYSGKIKS